MDRPFHIASIGKTFTSVLAAMLVEEGRLDYEDPVNKYLEPEILEGLFVVKDFHYSEPAHL